MGCFLVYDVTNRESFLALEGWRQQLIKDSDTKIVVMLLGNKVDMPNKVVSSEEGQEYARSCGWGFMEVSGRWGAKRRHNNQEERESLGERFSAASGCAAPRAAYASPRQPREDGATN